MGFFDRLRKKKDGPAQDSVPNSGASEQPKRIKKYTSDGKPVYD